MSMAARVGDAISGHDDCGPVTIITGSPDVFIEGSPLAKIGDLGSTHGCDAHSPHSPIIIGGSGTVIMNGSGPARVGDSCDCGSSIIGGASTVSIGG